MKKLFKREEGFTIIEVVLVLAIAGLIFLVVFLALPQLQRSRRDTQRRSDVGRILASLETYASNHDGDYPEDLGSAGIDNFGTDKSTNPSFLNSYFDEDNFQDPTDGEYTRVNANTDLDEDRPGEMNYDLGYDCDGAGGDRYISVRMQLEQDTFCQDNR